MRLKIIITLAILLVIAIGVNIYQGNKIKKQDFEIGSLSNNVRAYQNIANNDRVLQFKLSDLRGSDDKLIQSLDSTRNALKLAKKELKQASVIKSSLNTKFTEKINRDSSVINNNIINCDFLLDKYLNSETHVNIKSINDSITVELNIQNIQYLFVYSHKEWRNNRNNFFDRLFHWDWKKDLIFRYKIENSNPLIKIEDTRIINIQE